jgi:hypothetical protein
MRAALVYALLTTGMALGWQALTVHFNYGGDWSALFDTGGYTEAPRAIADEGVYRFPGSPGYDGQYYHFIAHDPLLLGDTARYVDNPRLRWRRILIPGLAFLFAGGDGERIDSAYGVVVLAFVFLGSLWLARWCARCGLHPAWCVTFILVPGVLVSLDRYTVDVALAALCIGFAWYGVERCSLAVFAVLALAPLARETGLILAAAFGAHALWRRNWRAAAFAGAAAVPFGAWLWYVSMRTVPDQTVFASWVPFRGLIERTLHPFPDSVATRWLFTAAVLECVAVVGIWLAVALAFRLLWKGRRDLLAIAAALFATVFVAFLAQPQAWAGVYTFGRTMSPLLIWLALMGAASRQWPFVLPLAMTVPRLLFQLGPQWWRIVHGLLH